MTYSTGSGDYNALMAAVLAHALTDGWTEAGGLGTGWPIISPSGRVRGVDWTTYTASEADLTLGGDGLTKTQRYIRLGIGTSGANATTNAALSTAPYVANMAYTFTNWYIFSEIAVNEHIHVVVEFSNGATGDCYSHMSFGEVDKGGLTYNSIAYATGTNRRCYAVDSTGGNGVQEVRNGSDWNTLNRSRNMWAGNWGESDDGSANTAFMTHATTSPHPNAAGSWPATDAFIVQGTNLWAKNARMNDVAVPSLDEDRDAHFGNVPWYRGLNAHTGFVPLGPIPFIMINGTGVGSRTRWMGVYPNVRFASVEGITPGDEFTFGADTWKIFPMSRATPWTLLNQRYQVTSGYAGYAYKKVI